MLNEIVFLSIRGVFSSGAFSKSSSSLTFSKGNKEIKFHFHYNRLFFFIQIYHFVGQQCQQAPIQDPLFPTDLTNYMVDS